MVCPTTRTPRVYFSPDDLVQAEFIQYLSEGPGATAQLRRTDLRPLRMGRMSHGSRVMQPMVANVHFQPWSGVSLAPALTSPSCRGGSSVGRRQPGSSSNPAIEQAALDAVGSVKQ